MAKRFTDSEKWKDAWFMDLPSKYKLFWVYLLDDCDHSGVWKVNFKVASFYIGEHLEYSEVKRVLKSRIKILNDDYWHLIKFIKYQYNTEIQGLNPKNRVHFSVIKRLNNFDEFKPLTRGLEGAKDKDKDKDNNIIIEKIENSLFSLEDLKQKYLSNEAVVKAVISEPKNKVKNLEDLKKHLNEFCEDLKQSGRQSEKWNEFTRYFLNCLRSEKYTKNRKNNKKQQIIPLNEFISNPYD